MAFSRTGSTRTLNASSIESQPSTIVSGRSVISSRNFRKKDSSDGCSTSARAAKMAARATPIVLPACERSEHRTTVPCTAAASPRRPERACSARGRRSARASPTSVHTTDRAAAPSLSDEQAKEVARVALRVEQHYGCPMDIEWGKDGATGELYILQARPATVQSRAGRTLQRFTRKSRSRVLA